MSSAADALASEGAPVFLHHPTRGRTKVRARYTFASLRKIEQEFGGLPELMTAFTEAATFMDLGMRVAMNTATPEEIERHKSAPSEARMFDTVARALAPALLDEPWEDREGNTVWLGEDIDTLARAMDFADFNEYVQAFVDGFAESFKDMHAAKGTARPPAVAASRSRGPRGGTSSSGKPASRKPSSGA